MQVLLFRTFLLALVEIRWLEAVAERPYKAMRILTGGRGKDLKCFDYTHELDVC
jgi:hypothetical protein